MSICAVGVTPFGDDGPWSAFKASDLVHLALGGVIMNCGYDPAPFSAPSTRRFSTPRTGEFGMHTVELLDWATGGPKPAALA